MGRNADRGAGGWPSGILSARAPTRHISELTFGPKLWHLVIPASGVSSSMIDWLAVSKLNAGTMTVGSRGMQAALLPAVVSYSFRGSAGETSRSMTRRCYAVNRRMVDATKQG